MKNIGIDIGKKRCFTCVMDDDGRILEEGSYCNTQRDAARFAEEALRRHGSLRAVCESTGNMWIKTYDEFERNGIPITLANPLKTRAIAEARVKTDKVDARTLAHLLRGDLIAGCHVPSLDVRSQKEAIRHRIRLVQDRTRVSNRMHALLDKYDIAVVGNSMAGVKNMASLAATHLPSAQDDSILRQCLRHIGYLNDEIKRLDREIAGLASGNEYARRMMSITGFDSFAALLIALEIDDIGRFATPKKLVSWMGMCPTVHQSGNTIRHGRMRKDSNRRVNWIMIQAALVASFKDERMRDVYERAKKRHPHQVAVTHVANKLAVIIWHLLHDGTLYDQRNDGLYARKLKKIKQ